MVVHTFNLSTGQAEGKAEAQTGNDGRGPWIRGKGRFNGRGRDRSLDVKASLVVSTVSAREPVT